MPLARHSASSEEPMRCAYIIYTRHISFSGRKPSLRSLLSVNKYQTMPWKISPACYNPKRRTFTGMLALHGSTQLAKTTLLYPTGTYVRQPSGADCECPVTASVSLHRLKLRCPVVTLVVTARRLTELNPVLSSSCPSA